jgi:hypothetical protein
MTLMLIVSKFFLRIFEFSNHFPCSVGVSRGVAVMELTAKLTIRNESSADFFIFFLQWCHGGSLFDLIHRSPHELPKEHKLRLATGAAAGGIVFFTTALPLLLYYFLRNTNSGWLPALLQVELYSLLPHYYALPLFYYYYFATTLQLCHYYVTTTVLLRLSLFPCLFLSSTSYRPPI